jgi:hypothetical protein
VTVHVFGIRHHGPGSARSLRHALDALLPDILLVEGPPDAEHLLAFASHEQMQPPVALLVHVAGEPGRAVFYPFASFSPEWQAIVHGARRAVPVRFMDLAQAHRFAMGSRSARESEGESEGGGEESRDVDDDPLSLLARAAGFEDGERWWDFAVESRRDPNGVFEAVLEAMTALRQELHGEIPTRNAMLERRREAAMRRAIRAAVREGFQRIAVVCGAWHAPALLKPVVIKEDDALLKGLPKLKVDAAWVPWSYGRLTLASGYGAGVASPAWYDHLFHHDSGLTERWLTKAARLLREEDLDASPAHVIDASRLAEALAALRERPAPGLDELCDAARSVLCFGDPTPLRLIGSRLIVGERLGRVPDDAPAVPLARDLAREQKRLRFAPKAEPKMVDLDLRRELDRERSQLLHRLVLLGIEWGVLEEALGKKGTFHELWNVCWNPELAVAIVEACRWGNTVHDAATSFATDQARRKTKLADLTTLLDGALLAHLPLAVARIAVFLRSRAAVASDVDQLMDALPSLAGILRYGDVRKTDSEMVAELVDGIVPRICIGLPAACAALADDAADAMFARIESTHAAIRMLSREPLAEAWYETLRELANQDIDRLHGLIGGRACRLLRDADIFDASTLAQRLSFALSASAEPARAAAWTEGLLRGSGPLLVHDPALWQILDDWLCELADDTFTTTLPLLRRTFATFTPPERRSMGERLRRSAQSRAHPDRTTDTEVSFDEQAADAALSTVAALLGLTPRSES